MGFTSQGFECPVLGYNSLLIRVAVLYIFCVAPPRFHKRQKYFKKRNVTQRPKIKSLFLRHLLLREITTFARQGINTL